MAKTIKLHVRIINHTLHVLYTIRIDKEFIGAVIGPGGKIIQEMQRETGATISIEEKDNQGIVQIFADDKALSMQQLAVSALSLETRGWRNLRR
jgi:polyribonucleotide nucleotidyltransferase